VHPPRRRGVRLEGALEVAAGSDPGPIKRGAGVSFMAFRAGLGRSSAVVRVDAKGKYSVHVGVTDVGGGAKTTMGLIAAEELGVPLSQLEVVWGDTDAAVLGRRVRAAVRRS